jgi:hypothetical protein
MGWGPYPHAQLPDLATPVAAAGTPVGWGEGVYVAGMAAGVSHMVTFDGPCADHIPFPTSRGSGHPIPPLWHLSGLRTQIHVAQVVHDPLTV